MNLARLCNVFILCIFASSVKLGAASIELKGSMHADHRKTPRLEFPGESASKANSAAEYLTAHNELYKIPADLSNLEVVSVRHSIIGVHTRYRQLLNGLPVEGAEIIVSQRKLDGSIYQVYNNTFPVTKPVAAAKNVIGRDVALQKAWDHLRVYGSLKSLPKADLMYVPNKTGFKLIYKTLICVDGPFGYWEHKVDALTGGVISIRRHEISEKYKPNEVPDFSLYRGPVKSLSDEMVRIKADIEAAGKAKGPVAKSTVNGTALVFDPDPKTTLNNAGLLDSSPASTFDPAYFTNTLRDITLDTGVYYLQGPWVNITNMASELPATAVSTTSDGNWTAKRGNNAFNDVMCYFHIDQNQRYLQSLGYTNATSIQAVSIPVDSDGLDGADNAWYVPSQNYLAFGHGGVDDAEDSDVILHEYGHALTFGVVPSWGGGDSGAIGEGYGDYWGGSYSWSRPNGTNFNPAWACSWDGHGADTWAGRFLNMTNLTYDYSHNYEAHETIDAIPNYSDQLWSAPIYMAFRDLINMGYQRTEMDTIIMESFFGVGNGVKMRDMADATVMAAMELFPTGQHASVYYTRFMNQLIATTYPLQVPTLIYPVGGEIFATGSVINVLWNRNGALPKASAQIEYCSEPWVVYFYDQVESGQNGWGFGKTGGTDWYIITSTNHSPTHSWFATDDTSTCSQFLIMPSISVSNGAVLSFWHYYDLESSYDGAVVEISASGGPWIDLGTNATQNGYNMTLLSGPIAGRPAFSGSSGGFIETRIPLSAYEGQNVQIRFRESDDSSEGVLGWYVDDIKIEGEPAWTLVAITPTNASSHSWTLPIITGTNYAVRVKLIGSNCTDSAWSTSSPFTIAETRTFTVNGPGYGLSSPAYGVYTNVVGMDLACVVTNSPVVLGGGTTQYVCTGWSMSGNVPTNGSDTNCMMQFTNNATLTWNWQMQYKLAVTTNGSGIGTVTGNGNGWHLPDSSVTVTGVPSAHCYFAGWSGDVPSEQTNNTVVTMLMNQPYSIAIHFDANMAANNTPYWWLAQYGIPTNEAGTLYDEGDGIPAWQEYIADTDPTNKQSILALVGIRPEAGNIRIEWEGGLLATQYIQICTNLCSASALWQSIYTNGVLPTLVTNFFIDYGRTNPILYYRVKTVR
ncbi:MAG: immune inhibitor A [Kiritimatiellae bacterium]|nr:immune inhibitor A [Kiritimatiellia bacterium]